MWCTVDVISRRDTDVFSSTERQDAREVLWFWVECRFPSTFGYADKRFARRGCLCVDTVSFLGPICLSWSQVLVLFINFNVSIAKQPGPRLFRMTVVIHEINCWLSRQFPGRSRHCFQSNFSIKIFSQSFGEMFSPDKLFLYVFFFVLFFQCR